MNGAGPLFQREMESLGTQWEVRGNDWHATKECLYTKKTFFFDKLCFGKCKFEFLLGLGKSAVLRLIADRFSINVLSQELYFLIGLVLALKCWFLLTPEICNSGAYRNS